MPRSKRRNFTADFKAQVVLDLLSRRSSQAELCRKHQLSPSLLTLWKETFQQRLPIVFQSDEHFSQQQARVARISRLRPSRW